MNDRYSNKKSELNSSRNYNLNPNDSDSFVRGGGGLYQKQSVHD